MSQSLEIDKIVQIVINALGNKDNNVASTANVNTSKLTVNDYPLGAKRQDLVRTPTGKKLADLTLKGVIDGTVKPEDLRIAPETLELQAQIAESAGRAPFARNLRRAAELIVIPDERVLEIYNALRPNRSTQEELLVIANELQNKYGATINSAFVREAAEVYAKRGILRKD